LKREYKADYNAIVGKVKNIDLIGFVCCLNWGYMKNVTNFDDHRFAGLRNRVIAVICDMLFKGLIVLPMWAIQLWIFKEKAWLYENIIARIDPIYYIILLCSPLQATFGMMLMKIKIIDRNGNRITLLRSISRYLVCGSWYLILILIFKSLNIDIYWALVGLILPGFMHFHPQKQTFYDIICGTYIICTNSRIKS
jgi:uncharacterized RDD family membrane protein YckC